MGKPIRNTALFRTITGRNKTGKIIHGILDVAPFPNLHELVKARAKDHPGLSIGGVTKLALKGLDPLRTIISTGIGISIIFVLAKGWATVEQIKEWNPVIRDFVQAFTG